jgi:hypothetical protein
MNDKEITQEESLQIIQQMIDKAKNKVTDDGFHFLLWGILVFTACLVEYIMLKEGAGNMAYLVWIIMPVAGGLVAFFYEWKKQKTSRTRTYIEKISAYIWLGAGITLFLSIFIALSNASSPIPYVLVIIGLATFISGMVISYPPIILGGIVFWISALACIAVTGPEQLLINAGAVVLGYILPGTALWRKYKNQDRV